MSPLPKIARRPDDAPALPHPSPAIPDLVAAAARARADRPTLPRPGQGATLDRWRALAAWAAQDVCLVKVMEAHHDAHAILAELDAPPASADLLYAVWAAEPPDARVEFVESADGAGVLRGTKAWCSGASIVDRALVTAHMGEARVLVQVDLGQPGVEIAEDGWHAVGMARVHSGRVGFRQARAQRIGAPGAYLARPGFWHGGAGIAACWFGAAGAIADVLRVDARVARDAHAAAHLGAIDIGLTAAAALLRETAAAIDAHPEQPHVDAVMRVRSLLERVATDTVDRVGRHAFEQRAYPHHRIDMRLLGVRVDGRRGLAQQRGRGRESNVDRAQVRSRVRIARDARIDAQHIGDRAGRTEPACGDACTAMPETRTREIRARRTDALRTRLPESDPAAVHPRHADRMPAVFGDLDAGLPQIDLDQHARLAHVRGHQRAVHDRGTRAPGLGAPEHAGAVRAFDEFDSRIRRLGRPHRVQQVRRRGRCIELGQDRVRVVVRLHDLDQADVLRGPGRQRAPAIERGTLPRTRQRGPIRARTRRGGNEIGNGGRRVRQRGRVIRTARDLG